MLCFLLLLPSRAGGGRVGFAGGVLVCAVLVRAACGWRLARAQKQQRRRRRRCRWHVRPHLLRAAAAAAAVGCCLLWMWWQRWCVTLTWSRK